jgi:phospholipase/carboxylesterase
LTDSAARIETLEVVAAFRRDAAVRVCRPVDGANGALLVALHGQGMSGRRFAREILPLTPDGVTVLLPDAPMPFEVRRPHGIRQGNAWYVYTGDEAAFVDEMARTGAWVLELIDRTVAEHGLDAGRVDLLGFSQGGYLAGYVGIAHAERFRRLVVAGGRMKHEVLEDAARDAAARGVAPALLCVHGENDPSVRPAAVRESFEVLGSWGVPGTFRTYPAEHDVLRDAGCRADVRAFLAG